MMSSKLHKIALSAAVFASVSSVSGAFASDRLMNREFLSLFEKPLATEIGDVTLRLRGSLEETVKFDRKTDEVSESSKGVFEFSAETQLRNKVDVGVSYGGQYETHASDITSVGGGGSDDEYTDTAMAFASGVWGKVSIGNVSGTVNDETERAKKVGNAALAYAGGFGGLADWAVAYAGRIGPAVVSAVLDEEKNGSAGIRFSRPLGNKDFGFAVRGTMGTFLSADETTKFDTRGAMVVADVIYGSTLIDLGVGYEEFRSTGVDTSRTYGSLGLQHKVGAVTVSASGHLGRLDGNLEKSVAIGGRYDIVRGLSANFGVNYAKLDAVVDGVTMEKKDAVEGLFSLRYDF